jgi:hypothetical protein
MAITYYSISSQILSSSAASITFSSIPATYTDLVLKVSARTDTAGSFNGQCQLTFNSNATNYSGKYIRGNGSTALSSGGPTTYIALGPSASDSAGNGANTFTSVDVYIPSYLISQNKQASDDFAAEDNTATGFNEARASLWSSTAAITSVTLTANSGGNFVAGSTFYLYGIKNS